MMVSLLPAIIGIIGDTVFSRLPQPPSILRLLRKAIERHMPSTLKDDHEFVPGGDLRVGGNTWLRNAFDSANLARVPREGEVRRVVHQLVNIYDLCTLAPIIEE